MRDALLPFEFVVEQAPVSHQVRDRERLQAWKRRVYASARRTWTGGPIPITTALIITVVYYHDRVAVRMDNDNMVKPIQDALNGLIYTDDRQITDTIVRKRFRRLPFREDEVPEMLAEALEGDGAFVYVIIDLAPDHREVPR